MARILGTCFFPAFFPNLSGGELRLFNFYNQLGKVHEVELITLTYPIRYERIIHPNFVEHRIPKPPTFDSIYNQLSAMNVHGERAGLVAALSGREDEQFAEHYRQCVANADIIIHDFPYMLTYDSLFLSDGKPRIYNSHNFETGMFRSLAHGNIGQAQTLIRTLECQLARTAALVFATSPVEKAQFQLYFGVDSGRIDIVPNGFDAEAFPSEQAPVRSAEGPLLFLGSAHPPNIEAARYIARVMAPAMPEHDFEIAGAVCDDLGLVPDNVKLLGKVDEAGKRAAFARASLFVNAISMGAGTSLKMVEAMAAGLPILTTAIGARGLDLVSGRTAIITDVHGFPAAARKMLADSHGLARLGREVWQQAQDTLRWDRIAERAAAKISALCDGTKNPASLPLASHGRRRILVLNDYSIDNPIAGGAKRLHEILTHVSENADVVFLCLGRQSDVITRVEPSGLVEICVPKTAAQAQFEDHMNGRNAVSVNDIASSLFCQQNETLLDWFRRLNTWSDLIVLAHPYMAPLLETVRPLPPVIYESHNIEAQIKQELLRGHSHGRTLSSFTGEVERLACTRADDIIVTTQSDAQGLETLYNHGKPTTIVMNGGNILSEEALAAADAGRESRATEAGLRLVFVGSAHPPNVEAASWLLNTLMPQLPQATLWLIGNVCDSVSQSRSRQLKCFGVVSDEEKMRLLAEADLAVNPLFSGGGSSLKMADYLGAGLPVVATPTGARGFPLEPGRHVIVAQPADFARAVRELAADMPRRRAMGSAGYQFAAQTVGWPVLARNYANVVERHARRHRKAAGRPLRMLVVTYRYTEPPRGGAEEYLYRLLCEYAQIAPVSIDIVAPAVGDLGNMAKFATAVGQPPASHSLLVAPFARNVTLLPVDPVASSTVLDDARCVYDGWIGEDLVLSRYIGQGIDESCLLGGFYDLERSGSDMWVWTSGKAEIQCSSNTTAIRIHGCTERGAISIDLAINGQDNGSVQVTDQFSIEVWMENSGCNIITLHVPKLMFPNEDPRSLGVRVTGVDVLTGGIWRSLPLDRNYERLAKARDPWRWIDGLRQVAEQRLPEVDVMFDRMRGPHCSAMSTYLDEVAANYDVALVQGIQFGVSMAAVDRLKDLGIPLILLPHYHVDDRFYHWSSFYKAIRTADRVLSFSPTVSANFLKPLGGNAVEIAGGGVTPGEYFSPDNTIAAFRAVWSSERPFALVLGRKTGSKNYRLAISAHQQLIAEGAKLDLILIGPDEDHQPIVGDNVYYLGSQPREVVIGALQSCLCLVTMSESESYGIVIAEAWMCGKPVIARRSCLAFSELVDHGQDGILADTEAELAEGLSILLEDSAFSAQLGSVGRAKALERYTWLAAAERLDDIVQAMMEGAA